MDENAPREHRPQPDLCESAPRGERARGKAQRNWGKKKNVSLVCAIGSGAVKPSMSVEGAVDGEEALEVYLLRHFLAPALDRGQIVVVMDNLCVHKSKRVEAIIEEAGAEILCSSRRTRRTSSTP